MTETTPELYGFRPLKQFSRVVFPDPEGLLQKSHWENIVTRLGTNSDETILLQNELLLTPSWPRFHREQRTLKLRAG